MSRLRLLLAAMGGGSFTVAEMNLGWLSVATYGATGNGTTDDTTAIQAALTAVPSTGGVVYFPPGDYLVSDPLTVKSSTLILGAGGGVARDYSTGWITRIKTASGAETLLSIDGQNIGIRDLFLHCTSAGTPTAGAAVTVTATAGAGNNLHLEDVAISGFYRGLDISYGSEWSLTRVRVVNPVIAGLRVENIASPDGTDATMDDVWLMAGPRTDQTNSVGIVWRPGDGLRMSNIKINAGDAAYWGAGRWGRGMLVDVARATGGTQIQISNSSFEGIQSHGIEGSFSGAGTNFFTDFLISNTEIASNGANSNAYGMVFTGVSSSVDFRMVDITGCVFRADNTSTAAAVALSTCQKIRVTGCQHVGFSALTNFVTCTDAVASP